jgi:hypothetical protein
MEATSMRNVTPTITLVLSLISVSYAQVPPSTAFDYKPFNISREDLPSHYAGNSLGDIYLALKSLSGFQKKDEFESTIDYKARLRKAASHPLIGSLTGDSIMAFSISNPAFVAAKYDADLSVLDLSFDWLRWYDVSLDRLSVRYSRESKFRRSYVAKNRLGSKTMVSVYDTRELWLACAESDLQKIDGIKGKYPFDVSFSASTPLPPREAKSAKQNLRVLIVGILAEQPTNSQSDFHSPTMSEPVERYTIRGVVNMTPIAIWFYDAVSGRVLVKLSLK